jgi:hypothetical protein
MWLGEGGMMIGVWAGGRATKETGCGGGGGTAGMYVCMKLGGDIGMKGEGAESVGEEVGVVGLTWRNISMSNGTCVPDRSNHRRIVSGDDCGVVTSRICCILWIRMKFETVISA